MRSILTTIIVAMLVTGCSAVQRFRTDGAADVELIDEENSPPEETDSDDELIEEEPELPESFLGDGNPQYAMSPAALEDSEPRTTTDTDSPENVDEYQWLAETLDNYKEVPGC
jgi:hypothetical protein